MELHVSATFPFTDSCNFVLCDETLVSPALLNPELISHFYDQLYVPTDVALTYWLRSKYFDDMNNLLIILLAIRTHT